MLLCLLNIGPRADGTIPDEVQQRIRDIGKWLKVNGEGVYSTRPWTTFGEGETALSSSLHGDQVEFTNEDIRFTRSKDNKTLYIHVLAHTKDIAILFFVEHIFIEIYAFLWDISIVLNA